VSVLDSVLGHYVISTHIPNPRANFLYDFGLTASGQNNGRRHNYA